jgi:hypothetical protein
MAPELKPLPHTMSDLAVAPSATPMKCGVVMIVS